LKTVASKVITGDELLTVYDYQAQTVLISFADFQNKIPAYSRSPTFLNMTELFSL